MDKTTEEVLIDLTSKMIEMIKDNEVTVKLAICNNKEITKLETRIEKLEKLLTN